MFSWLLGSGQSIPYEFGDEDEDFTGKTIWKLRAGKDKKDGSPVSIFVFDLANRSETEKEAARNALKRCKTIKHPYIVRFVDGAEMADNKGGGMLYIVTEPISPLEPELKREGGLPQPALAWGLRSIVSAVAFLHKGGMMHANVHLSSIFVNKAGDWKLSGLELVCSPHTGGADALGAVKELLPRKLQSPELARGQLAVLEQADAGVTDSWLLGVLVYEVFNGRLERAEQLKNTTRLPPALVKHYTQLLSGTAPTRLRAAELLGNAFLNHAYCGTQEFVENLNVQDAAEKERFFATLTEHVSEIPPAAAKYKFLPALIQNLEYGGGSARILTPMLHIAKALSEDEFQRQVVPIVSKLFANNDRAMRMPLLELLPSFVASVPERVLNENIFPSMCNGFVDASAQLREMTVKAMVPLAPRLNQRSLGHVLRAFANLQRDEEAAIRTNTTICLGKITQYLDPTSRQRVLIAAFSRALLDPFPPARRAGALSLAATQSFHSAADCARKIVPAVAPLAIDPDPDVRKAALQCLAVYMAKLDGESRRMAARDAGEEEPSVPDAMAVATNVAQESVMESMTWVSSMLGKVGLSAAAAAAAKAAEAAKAASAKPKEADPSKPAMLTPTPAAPAPAPTPAAPTPACGGGAGGDGMGVGAGAAGKPPMQPAAPPMQPAATARPPQPAAPPNVNAGGVSSSNLSDLLGDADFDTAFSEPFAPPPAPPAGQGTPVAAGGASGGLARADSGASGGGATPAKPAKLAAHKASAEWAADDDFFADFNKPVASGKPGAAPSGAMGSMGCGSTGGMAPSLTPPPRPPPSQPGQPMLTPPPPAPQAGQGGAQPAGMQLGQQQQQQQPRGACGGMGMGGGAGPAAGGGMPMRPQGGCMQPPPAQPQQQMGARPIGAALSGSSSLAGLDPLAMLGQPSQQPRPTLAPPPPAGQAGGMGGMGGMGMAPQLAPPPGGAPMQPPPMGGAPQMPAPGSAGTNKLGAKRTDDWDAW